MVTLLYTGALMGLGATVLIDLWALVLQRLARVALPNWAMVGRWVMHLPRGRLFHENIAAAQPMPKERQIGWVFHYFVGVVYGVFFALLAGPDWISAPTFLPVFIYALLTIVGGWFLLHPGLGLGWAVSKAENPNKVRILGLLSHSVFGLGLWLVGLLLAFSTSYAAPG
ncbi:MAG: DUF2938 domain-containing protein [Marinovum sp.]|jgi:hypothetical protein|nr:DUF2938 domain-containing protein [Marinovum sp.]